MEDPTWKWRLVVGLSVLAIFAAVDCYRHPKNPTKIREYCFLFGVTGLTMLYGLIHDLVTWSLSPDYYVIVKGIESASNHFFPDVAILAAKASWTVGLVIGLVLLVANNPNKYFPQLPYRWLTWALLRPLGYSIIFASVFGLAAAAEAFQFLQEPDGLDLPGNTKDTAFVAVWGVHIGTYTGAFFGLFSAAISVRRDRRTRNTGVLS